MGLRRGRPYRATRAAAVAGLIGTALLVAGCGESRHANEQRPSPSTRVSVTVHPREVIVQPLAVAQGPERTKQIPQNQNHPQPAIKGSKVPLNVVFVTANQTQKDLHLRVRGGKEAESGVIYANSPGSFSTALPTGSYTISVVGLPGAQPAHLTVGSFRASSQNEVLLP
ncbi:MAG: hypothetical protein ACTHNP_02535 [Solirubrobacterales bacterium]